MIKNLLILASKIYLVVDTGILSEFLIFFSEVLQPVYGINSISCNIWIQFRSKNLKLVNVNLHNNKLILSVWN